MAETIGELITKARLFLGSTRTQRFTDDDMLILAQSGVERLNFILFQNGVWFGRDTATVTTAVGDNSYAIPTDMLQVYGLYRDATHDKLQNVTEDDWEQIVSAAETSYWLLRGDEILIAGTPQQIETLTLVYWPRIDVAAYDATTDAPWGDRLNSLIVDYVVTRAKSIDEGAIGADAQILAEMESRVISTYGNNNLSPSFVDGWSTY